MGEIHGGGCLCGEVRFTVSGHPLQVIVCHCTLCQRATGSAFSIEPVFPKERARLEGAPLGSYSHRSADHGRMMHFVFCKACGSRLGLTLERFPEVQILYGGAFDDPTWFSPTAHIFTASKVPWVVLPSDVPCFAQHMFRTR